MLSIDTVFERDNEGKVIKHIGIASDITPIKETQERLTKTNENLEQFTYIATHDLKVPVASIESLLSLLKDDTYHLSEGSKEVISYMDKVVVQAKKTIQNLLTVAKIGNKHDLKIEKCSFEEIFEEVITEFKFLNISKQATITSNFTKAPDIHYHKAHIKSIVHNLVGNAVKYKHPDRKPRIKIRTSSLKDYICISVKDNGLGINLPKDEEKVFGLFKRAHNVGEGNGMALYMIKKNLEANEGKIEVASKLNEGTTFRVYLKKEVTRER